MRGGGRLRNRMGVRMHEMGITCEELAGQLGRPPAQIVKWKNGIHEPTVTKALMIARALGVTVEALWPEVDG